MRQRIHSLDIIRIAATFAIIVFHWNIYAYHYGIDAEPVFHLPFATGTAAVPAVSLFFILSGASLMLSCRKNFTLKGYFLRRFLSIYPLYWLAYAVVFFHVYVLRHVPMDKPLITLPLSFLAMDGLLADTLNTWYLIGEWFVGCIVLLYLVFPLLRLAVKKAPGFSLLGGLLLAFLLTRVPAFPIDATHFPLTRVPEMLLGMVYVEIFYPDKGSRPPFVRVLGRFFGTRAEAGAAESEAFGAPASKYVFRRILLAAAALAAGLLPAFVSVNLPETLLPLLMGGGIFTGLELLLSLVLPKGRRFALLSAASGMTYGIFLVHHIYVGEFLGKYLGGDLPYGKNLLLFAVYLVFVTVLGSILTWISGKLVSLIRRKKRP